MTNEIANVNNEVLTGEVVREEKNYVVIKNEDGKFVRKAKFNEYSSVVVETKADKIWMMNLLEGNEDTANGLKEHVGKIIEVADIITRPYDKINEDTGTTEYGVLTYLLTPDRVVYVTSSKNVYFSINHILDLFGRPDEAGWENIQIKVLKEKGANGDMIKIKMVG
jgi:Phage Single-stranded DNA-binding protein